MAIEGDIRRPAHYDLVGDMMVQRVFSLSRDGKDEARARTEAVPAAFCTEEESVKGVLIIWQSDEVNSKGVFGGFIYIAHGLRRSNCALQGLKDSAAPVSLINST